jgi:signal transduction histidine kinase
MDKRLNELQEREGDLDECLRSILDTAVEWLDARYGALGVIGEDRFLSRFLTVGMDDAQAAAIGPLPQGHGLLGELIRHPVPLRLAELASHPSSYGFPKNHPPMHSFLGMPIHVGREVFGNLYLTEKRGGGEFDARDESLLWTLARAGGSAIDSVRWYRESRKRERGLIATATVAKALLAGGEPHTLLLLMVQQAMEIGEADLGIVAFPGDAPGTLSVEIAVGAGAARYQGLTLPVEGSFIGAALGAPGPIDSADLSRDARIMGTPTRNQGLGPAVAVQVRGSIGRGTSGILMIARVAGRPEFTPSEFSTLAAFASQAELGFELAEGRREAEQMMLKDRDRIARDLHDLAIQRIIGTGMALQSVERLIEQKDARQKVIAAVEELDVTSKIIRSTIFELQNQHIGVSSHGVRSRVVQAIEQAVPALGFTPALRMEGQLDTVVSTKLKENLSAALIEALSNIARHAHAHGGEVVLNATKEELVLTVVDDGVGMPEVIARRSGLTNLADRARSCGGEFSAERREEGGTRLVWRAPLHDAVVMG